MKKIIFIFLIAIAVSANAQVLPIEIRWVNTLPSACNDRDRSRVLVYKYSTPSGLYRCVSGSYSVGGGAGASVGSVAADQVFYGGAGGTLAQSGNFTFQTGSNHLTIGNGVSTSTKLWLQTGFGTAIFTRDSGGLTIGDSVVNLGTGAKTDENSTAGNTRFLIYDVDNATLERVTVGAG